MKKVRGCIPKPVLALLTAFVFFLILFGCHDLPDEPERTLIGFITVVGNDPFTKLALRTDNEEIYILKCDKITEAELWKMQGTKVVIYYRTVTVDYNGKNVNVIRYAVWK